MRRRAIPASTMFRAMSLAPKRFHTTQPLYSIPRREDDTSSDSQPSRGPTWPQMASPRQLVDYLNDYVVGQPQAKKVLAVAVYNHYNRIQANVGPRPEEHREEWIEPVNSVSGSSMVTLHPHPARRRNTIIHNRFQAPLFEKSNVLLVGPTGSGKTLLARTLARILDVPFSVSDATTFTQAGYVGDDVEMCVYRLLQAANWDTHRASTGIIYIDEADKLARRNSGGDGMSRDVGGEGVQQALLRMMEGSMVTVSTKGGETGLPGQDSKGKRNHSGPPQDTYQVDTSNVLFILSGAFVGLDSVVKRRVAKGSIGFGAQLKLEQDSDRDFTSFFTPNGRKTDVWDLVEPADLVKYGLIPEFISRLPILTTLHQLTVEDLLRILTEVKGSLISQYTALFGYSGVEIRFTTPALRAICDLAKDRGGGARGLRSIMEKLLLDSMYDVPQSGIRYVLITEAVVKGESPALYWSRGDGGGFWQAWAAEEDLDSNKQAKKAS